MDGIEEWTRAQGRVIELMESLTAEQAERAVPACPDWTVRDLFAHMVGLGTDVVAGDEPDDHNPGWTDRQVSRRRDRSVAELVDEWRRTTGPLQEWMRENGVRPLGDVIIHEQDLRGAVGVPGGQETPGLRSIRDRFTDRLEQGIGSLPPIALVGEQWTWSSGDSTPGEAAVVVSASDFDLARALMARRSADQLRTWTERGDVEPYLDAFATLGPLPPVDLSE